MLRICPYNFESVLTTYNKVLVKRRDKVTLKEQPEKSQVVTAR